MTPCLYERADTGDRDSGTRFRCSHGHGTGGADSDRDPGSGTGLFDHRIGRASVRIRGPDADARGDLGARDGLGVHQSRRCRYLGGCPRTVRLRLDQEPRLVVVRPGVMPPTDGHAGRNRFWTRDAGHTVAAAGARARARQACRPSTSFRSTSRCSRRRPPWSRRPSTSSTTRTTGNPRCRRRRGPIPPTHSPTRSRGGRSTTRGRRRSPARVTRGGREALHRPDA